MKQSTKFFIKALLVIVLFTTGSIALSTVGIKSVSEAKAAVSQQQVIQYLTAKGYTVITMAPYKGTADWIGHTILNGRDYMTHVYVTDNQIVGNEDVAM